MKSTLTTALRALTMLACASGVTALATSGTSWSRILDKFLELDWPIARSADSASPQANRDGGPIARPRPSGESHNTISEFQPTAVPANKMGETPRPEAPDSGHASERLGFRDVQERLKSLGATYYLLETWGGQRRLYRFSCEMGVGGHDRFNRCFEAVDADPLRSMLRVLRQVEHWRRR